MKKSSPYIVPLLATLFLLTGCQGYCATCDANPANRCLYATILILLIALFGIMLGFFSNILRDAVTDCDEFEDNKNKEEQKTRQTMKKPRNPYSLSKVQFAVWTLVISGAYIYLALCKCATWKGAIELNKTALVLMGISAGTVASATIIDKRQVDDGKPRHQNSPSKGLLNDILSDENGVSIHRFQNVVWTVIAIVIYIHKICMFTDADCGKLPELDDTLLVLTGISSATYLGLKAGENSNPEHEKDKDNGVPPNVVRQSDAPDGDVNPPAGI